MTERLAFVGATGGAGTTRLCLECAAALARAGDEVAVIDAALGTQGLATHVSGRIDPDLTSALADGAAFEETLRDVCPDVDGRVSVSPAHAPFERVARAKTREAAEYLEGCIDRVAERFDYVIVDVPPVADNPAVAAVTTVDRRVVVAPDSRRGADLVPRIRGRLVDVGAPADGLVANRVAGDGPSALVDADYAVPTGDRDAVRPASAHENDEFAVAVADLAGDLFGREIPIEPPSGGLLDR